MAKFECKLRGNTEEILNTIDEEICGGSATASFEDGSDFITDSGKCFVRVYERFSAMGGNRVSLNITLFETAYNEIFMSAVTSGGSQAVFFKMMTVGEETFLDVVKEAVERFMV